VDIFLKLTNEELRPLTASAEKFAWQNNYDDARPLGGVIGCSDITWVLRAEGPVPDSYKPGRIARLVLGNPPVRQ